VPTFEIEQYELHILTHLVTADDEASNATPAEQAQQQQQERKSSGPVGGFLNWLFGSGEDKKRDAAKSDSDSDNN